MTDSRQLPCLRPLDIRPIYHQGRPMLILRDPLNLSERSMLLPQALGPALMLCDGEHDTGDIALELSQQFGVRVEQGVVDELIEALDQALFLRNQRSDDAETVALKAYRSDPFRAPLSAGNGYPAEEEALRLLLDNYLEEVGEIEPLPADGKALISPHIDYQRGGLVYAKVWKRAAEMAKAADLVIVFGTDHYAGYNPITLTRQNYATPYGILPTNTTIVDALAEAISPENAYSGELYHRHEHSIELVVTWLHHIREAKAVELVPILTGSFHDYLHNGNHPTSHDSFKTTLDTLRETTAERQVLVVASGDLAHIGPAFGGDPIGIVERADLRAHDDDVLALLAAGDAEGFWQYIRRIEDSKNVCGVSPFYLTLSLLGQVEGEQSGYDVCPADENNTSVVSICGMVFG